MRSQQGAAESGADVDSPLIRSRVVCERHEAIAKQMLSSAKQTLQESEGKELPATAALFAGLHPALARALTELLTLKVAGSNKSNNVALQNVIDAVQESMHGDSSSASQTDRTQLSDMQSRLDAAEAALLAQSRAMMAATLANEGAALSSSELSAREAQLRSRAEALQIALSVARAQVEQLSQAVLFDAQVPSATAAELELLSAERDKLRELTDKHRADMLQLERQLVDEERSTLDQERARLAQAEAGMVFVGIFQCFYFT
jgi:hypothetical protein